ncbi:hypothetical protein N9E48_03230 [Paracoccaceae bacterium]|nr:hypothetical protein [Paracoccaceae bacterium]
MIKIVLDFGVGMVMLLISLGFWNIRVTAMRKVTTGDTFSIVSDKCSDDWLDGRGLS